MPRFEDRAFILGVADYRETSKLLRLLTESEGKLSLIARGFASPKSAKSAAVEPFALVRVTYTIRSNSTLGTLSAVELERVCHAVRTDLRAYALANYWFEVLALATQPNLPAHEVFVLTEQMLCALDGTPGPEPPILAHLARLLEALGFGMQLSRCGECGAVSLLSHFAIESGCAICSRCTRPGCEYFPLPEMPSGPAAGDWAALLELMHRMLACHLEHQLRSYPFLRDSFFPPAHR